MRRRDKARSELAAAVQAARSEGFSWRQIAQVLGVSRQAVSQRFGGAS
jgi:predicted transcriptional regulator